MILVGCLSILTRFCPVSCCYHTAQYSSGAHVHSYVQYMYVHLLLHTGSTYVRAYVRMGGLGLTVSRRD